MTKRLTVCVTGAGAGEDSAWEQKKLEARKMPENAAESPASSARGVRRFANFQVNDFQIVLAFEPFQSNCFFQTTNELHL